jgi:tetratricopeptide (TPR) repeat protein
VRSIFLVSQSDAKQRFLEEIMHTALGDEIRLCGRAETLDCCHAIPCKRASEFERAGYRVQLHTGRDPAPASPSSVGGLVLVLVAEPTVDAFARYEDELHRRGRQHSVELLQYWLASDALSRVDFWRKWANADSPDVLVVRVEDILSSPRKTLERIFSTAGVEIRDHELDAGERAVADFPPVIDPKSLETNPRFARPCFVEYMNLLAQEASYLGYPHWQDRKTPVGPVTTIYKAKRALSEKDYEQAVALLAPFVGTSAVETDVRAMLGKALLDVGREIEGRRALEVVLRIAPDFLDGYTLLADHAYELGLNIEARGYLREAVSRPNGAAHVRKFLQRLKVDADLAREFPPDAESAPLPVERQSVIGGFQWILGRLPESEEVIDDHRRLPDDDALRIALLRSQEFMEFFERFDAGEPPSPVEEAQPVQREDVILALRWLLGRSLRSRAEADELLDSGSRDELRLRLVGAEEFKQSYRQAA